MRPCLSIVIPVYNTACYLPGCLDSILAQDGCTFEVVLVDDGSSDGSADICDAYAGRDSRVRVLHTSNAGVSHARNMGLNLASGEYVWLVDSDDRVLKNALSRLEDVLRDLPDMVVFEEVLFGDSGMREGRIPAPSCSNYASDGPLLCGDSMYPHCRVFKRSLAGNVRFNESLSFLEDRDFVYRICRHLEGHVEILREPLYGYLTVRSGSAMNSLSLEAAINGLNVHRGILLSEIACGRSMPAYEAYIDLCIGVLGRIAREGDEDGRFVRIRAEMLSFNQYARNLHGALAAKYILCKWFPWLFKAVYSFSAARSKMQEGRYRNAS